LKAAQCTNERTNARRGVPEHQPQNSGVELSHNIRSNKWLLPDKSVQSSPCLEARLDLNPQLKGNSLGGTAHGGFCRNFDASNNLREFTMGQ